MAKATDIVWDTDFETDGLVSLPDTVNIPVFVDDDDPDAVADYLSDTYGWCVISLNVVEEK